MKVKDKKTGTNVSFVISLFVIIMIVIMFGFVMNSYFELEVIQMNDEALNSCMLQCTEFKQTALEQTMADTQNDEVMRAFFDAVDEICMHGCITQATEFLMLVTE